VLPEDLQAEALSPMPDLPSEELLRGSLHVLPVDLRSFDLRSFDLCAEDLLPVDLRPEDLLRFDL
jgi:hypothetical protein